MSHKRPPYNFLFAVFTALFLLLLFDRSAGRIISVVKRQDEIPKNRIAPMELIAGKLPIKPSEPNPIMVVRAARKTPFPV